jgi:hypothetical protein
MNKITIHKIIVTILCVVVGALWILFVIPIISGNYASVHDHERDIHTEIDYSHDYIARQRIPKSL